MKRFVKHIQTVEPPQLVNCDCGRFVSDMIPVKELQTSVLAPSVASHENASMSAVLCKTSFNVENICHSGQ